MWCRVSSEARTFSCKRTVSKRSFEIVSSIFEIDSTHVCSTRDKACSCCLDSVCLAWVNSLSIAAWAPLISNFRSPCFRCLGESTISWERCEGWEGWAGSSP